MSDLLLLCGETDGEFYFSSIVLSDRRKDESLVFSLKLPFPQVLGQMSASVCVSLEISKQQKQHGSVRGEGESAQSEWTMAQSEGGEGGKIKGVQVLLK